MKDAIERNVMELTKMLNSENRAGDKMQIAQAILNLAHALATLNNIK